MSALDDFPLLSGVLLGACIFAVIWFLCYLANPKFETTHGQRAKPTTLVDFDNVAALAPFNGTKSATNPQAAIYIAVAGKVYDMSAADNFYGPGCPYGIFAGTDASRALALTKVERALLNQPLGELTQSQQNTLQEWIDKYDSKYPVVGRLVNPPH